MKKKSITTVAMLKEMISKEKLNVTYEKSKQGNTKIIGKKILFYVHDGKNSIIGWNNIDEKTAQLKTKSQLKDAVESIKKYQKE